MPEALTAIIILILGTAFLKIFLILSILRYGLGLKDSGFGIVIAALSIVISLLMISPYLPLDKFLSGETISYQTLKTLLTPYIERADVVQAESQLRALLQSQAKVATAQGVVADFDPFIMKLTAYVITEIKAASEIGLKLLIPFILIDLLVAHILALINITTLSAYLVSLPLKLLLFLSVDGWGLIVSKLVTIARNMG
jgi:flagellar biosynthetic protein FliP